MTNYCAYPGVKIAYNMIVPHCFFMLIHLVVKGLCTIIKLVTDDVRVRAVLEGKGLHILNTHGHSGAESRHCVV